MSERERFEEYCNNRNVDPKSLWGICIWEGWQAALSTRKPFGFGLVDKDGNGRVGFGAFSTKGAAESECYYMNDPVKNVHPLNGSPFRVVTLFYEDSES